MYKSFVRNYTLYTSEHINFIIHQKIFIWCSVAGHFRSEPTKAFIHNTSKHCITLTTESIRRMLVNEGSKIKITVNIMYFISHLEKLNN